MKIEQLGNETGQAVPLFHIVGLPFKTHYEKWPMQG
jgi:hypothetical protein